MISSGATDMTRFRVLESVPVIWAAASLEAP
jgi:hypothetical protein